MTFTLLYIIYYVCLDDNVTIILLLQICHDIPHSCDTHVWVWVTIPDFDNLTLAVVKLCCEIPHARQTRIIRGFISDCGIWLLHKFHSLFQILKTSRSQSYGPMNLATMLWNSTCSKHEYYVHCGIWLLHKYKSQGKQNPPLQLIFCFVWNLSAIKNAETSIISVCVPATWFFIICEQCHCSFQSKLRRKLSIKAKGNSGH